MNLLSRNFRSIGSMRSCYAIVSLSLNNLSSLQNVAQSFVIHNGTLVHYSDAVIGGVGE
jgi:hypothetical protein